jgi:hypothetical protein
MTRHRAIATAAALLLTAVAPLPAAAQVAKVQKLPAALRYDKRLVAVVAKGSAERRCVGASVGHFAVLTSYDCLADWWIDGKAHPVAYTTDEDRKYAYGIFERAWRGGDRGRWAMLQTYGHSPAYFGYEDLERTPSTSVFDFIGFSKKVKDGRQLAVQPGCRLTRVSAGVYTSPCGADFGTSAILLLRSEGNQKYVSGLAYVRSEAKVGKTREFTLETTSQAAYGPQLTKLRFDQASRFAPVWERMRAADAEMAVRDAERADRAAERRRENLDKLGTALGQLAATLGSRGQKVPPPIDYYPAPPMRTTPSIAAAMPAPTPVRRTTRGHWECDASSRCAGPWKAEVPPGGKAMLRYVSDTGEQLALLIASWQGAEPVQYGNQRLQLNVIAAAGPCTLTADMAFYEDGRLVTFLGGVGTGPEIGQGQDRTFTRAFSIRAGATLTVAPGSATCR